MDLKRDDHVKLADKLKQIQQDVEAINRVMQATYRKEFARAAHQIAHDLMSLRLSLAHKLDEDSAESKSQLARPNVPLRARNFHIPRIFGRDKVLAACETRKVVRCLKSPMRSSSTTAVGL
jgi:hypothetical protein